MGPWFAVGQRLPDGHLDGGDDRVGVQTQGFFLQAAAINPVNPNL